MSNNEKPKDDGALMRAVQAIAMRPEEARELAQSLKEQTRRKYPRMAEHDIADNAAERIVERFARMTAATGAASALPGVVPGIGTVVAVAGGATADAAASIKLQVDMCLCLAAAYDYDVTRTDAQHLATMIALSGAISKGGGDTAVRIGSQAAVRLLRRHLRLGALTFVKQLFKRVGITFTRKAAEKAIPFGIGVVVSGGLNYGLTKYVGGEARRWFMNDRSEGGPAVTMPAFS